MPLNKSIQCAEINLKTLLVREWQKNGGSENMNFFALMRICIMLMRIRILDFSSIFVSVGFVENTRKRKPHVISNYPLAICNNLYKIEILATAPL